MSSASLAQLHAASAASPHGRPAAQLKGEPPVVVTEIELEPAFFPLDMSLRSKDSIGLDSYCRMISTLQGRDKLTKAAAYGARALSYYAAASFNDKDSASAFEKLYEGLQSGRKVYRLAKPIEELRKFLAAWRKGDLPAWHISLLVAYHLGMSSFWVCDNVKFLENIGLSRFFSPGFTNAGCSRGWFVASCCTFVLAVFQLKKHREYHAQLWARYQGLRRREKEGSMESKTEPFGPEDDDDDTSAGDLLKLKTALYFANLKQFDLVTKIIKAVCDVLVSMNLPGMDLPKHVTGYRINEGVMGIAGAVSGLIIVYNNWPRRS